MFGFRNFTGVAFISKIGNFSIDFALGVIDEVSFNITSAGAANAAEIPENFNLNLVSKEKVITSTSLAITSNVLQSNVVGLIAGATPNLFF